MQNFEILGKNYAIRQGKKKKDAMYFGGKLSHILECFKINTSFYLKYKKVAYSSHIHLT